MLPELKQNLNCHTFTDKHKSETAVTRWLVIHDVGLYQHIIDKIVPRWGRCLTCGADYVEN